MGGDPVKLELSALAETRQVRATNPDPARRGLRAGIRERYRRRLDARASALAEPALGELAVVFAPHFDDETLGCGGTIVRKRAAGADVYIAWMTDGGLSHRTLMAPAELAARRAAEGRTAAAVLGIDEDHLFFLSFPEGALGRYEPEAAIRVAEVLRTVRPREIYVPYARDPQSDHVVTYRAVLAGLRMSRLEAVTIYEYPIWLWAHWPNVWASGSGGRRWRCVLRGLRDSLLMMRDFTRAVKVDSVLGTKQAALAAHQTQMTRVIRDARWLTLSDVFGGDFLSSFFDGYERFKPTFFQRAS